MREESLRYASLPCAPPKNGICDEELYRVQSTGALVTLSSSIALIYHYCSKLPSDRYFIPTPRFIFDEEFNKCTLHLPNSCPIQTVCVQGPKNALKNLVCLKACQKLHEIGALTDNLLPVSFDNEIPNCLGDATFEEKQANYFPGELVSIWPPQSEELYHCYRITMKKHYDYEVPFSDIILAVKFDLGNDFTCMDLELLVSRGSVKVDIKNSGYIHLDKEQVYKATKFQITVLRLLIDRDMNKLADSISSLQQNLTLPRVTYLLLPSTDTDRKQPNIDWDCVSSFIPTTPACSRDNMLNLHKKNYVERCHVHCIRTYDKVVCRCVLANSLVITPHNGYVYCVSGILDELDGNSLLKSTKEALTYKEHYRSKHGIYLKYDDEPLLQARRAFTVQNYLRKQQCNSEKESTTAWVELPPELCTIILSNISLDTLYSFSMLPSIMHRIESTLLAINLKILQIDNRAQSVPIPTMKVLEAITTKKCQEGFNLETLETLGDSFLKYAVSQQLYKSNEYHHEGLLTSQRERIVSNKSLCKLACKHNLQGFIRLECFDPKKWVIPGDSSECPSLKETSTKIYTMGTREMKSKRIADVVEALIGAYLITGGELSALFFMNWLGIKVDFIKQVPNDNRLLSQPDRHVSVVQLESILNHSFRDSSLLAEALTHGSYQLQEIPRCYQRLEFLGDSVLDYLITYYMFTKYPGISPGQLTNLRSSAVNNDCYALAAIKSGLHKHVLHMSSLLQEQIMNFMASNDHLLLVDTCGWESETIVPKVLGDIIESLAGAILIDSGYDKENVWNCIRPILEPLATLESMKIQPIVELENLCRSKGFEHYIRVGCVDGESSITVEVKVNGVSFTDTRSGMKKKEGKKLAAKTVLKMLKEYMVEYSL